MPILQSRLLSLLEAAETYQDKCKLVFDIVMDWYIKAARSECSHEEALNNIAIQFRALTSYSPVDLVIREERTRYNLTARRNVSMRALMQRRRGGDHKPGVDPQATSSQATSSQAQVNQILHDIEEGDPDIDFNELPQADDAFEPQVELPDEDNSAYNEWVKRGRP